MTTRNHSEVLLLLLFFFVFFQSCYEKPSFSFVPEISPGSLSKVTNTDGLSGTSEDIITVGINFKDGDGDLGLDPNDPPVDEFDPEGNRNEFYNNYFVDILIQEGEDFVPIIFPDENVIFDGRFRRLLGEDRVNPIEGELRRQITFFNSSNPNVGIPPNSLIKFRIKIRDRALNMSNEIETDTIRVRVQ